jgi:predicted RNase H-like HicB family nuclease
MGERVNVAARYNSGGGYRMKKQRQAGGSRKSENGAFKIIVEKHADGYVAYPLGLKGVVVGQGNTYVKALADVKSAIRFHVKTFGPSVLETDSTVSMKMVGCAKPPLN